MSILGHEQAGLALLSGALVGLSLGLTGAGSSLLVIPLLVYSESVTRWGERNRNWVEQKSVQAIPNS